MKDDLQKAARMAAEEIMKSLKDTFKEDTYEEGSSCYEDGEEIETYKKTMLSLRDDLYQIMQNFREKNDAQALINLGRLSAHIDMFIEK